MNYTEPYVPTPEDIIPRMLTLASVMPEEMVFDLGSGDGRILITAAKNFQARAVGVEGSDAPGERVPQKSEGDGTVSSNHDMVSQLQEGKLEKGRRSCSVSFELRSELNGAQVLERTEGWCQNSKF